MNNNSKMLKVVGASWARTRISTYILVGAGLLAIGSLFLAEMERPTYDGTYCATVYWFPQSGFHVEFWGQQNDLETIPKGVARTCYKDTTQENGWSKIEIETQPTYPDWIQAFSAGILEGGLTWQSIYNHWKNTIQSYCNESEKSQLFCTWLRSAIDANYENVKNMAEEHGKYDQYWHQINLFYNQLEGIEFGWRQGVRRARADLEIGMTDFLLINGLNDIADLRLYYENFVLKKETVNYTAPTATKSLILINFLMESGTSVIKKVLIGHSSDNSRSSMLRIFKKYKFHYHYTQDHKKGEVAGVDIVFTGYPGCIASTDDFYIIRGLKSKLTIGGTRIDNRNYELMKNVEIKNSVLVTARVMAANRLAHNGRTWAKLMSKNPGFGTKQWFVVDVKQLHQQKSNAIDEPSNISSLSPGNGQKFRQKNVLWIVDQIPGRLQAEDMSDSVCFNDGYWFSNGLPYFREIREATRVTDNGTNGFQTKLMKQIITNITDLDAMGVVLRTKAYLGNFTASKNLSGVTIGNVDVKLYSETNQGAMEFHALAGPMYYQKLFQSMLTKLQNTLMTKNDNTVVENMSHSSGQLVPNGNKFLAQPSIGKPADMFNLNHISPKWAWKHDNM